MRPFFKGGFTGCGKSQLLGGAALQRCDKAFISIGGF
jgi:hypothetical protein